MRPWPPAPSRRPAAAAASSPTCSRSGECPPPVVARTRWVRKSAFGRNHDTSSTGDRRWRVVAPRSLPDLSSLPLQTRGRPAETVDGLAVRWAKLCNGGEPRASAYLATLLRKLAGVLIS